MAKAQRIDVGGHEAWEHDEGWSSGVVHTFDALWLAPDDRPRKVQLLLPREYSSGGVYPAVYMNDGQTALFPGGPGFKSWRAGEVLSELREARKIRPVVLVAIHPVDRDVEYTHAPWFPGRPFGGLPGYAKYVAGPLKSFVERAYRIDPARERTMVLGSSHGGLAAFYTAMSAPERFGLVAAMSPSFWVGLGRNGSAMTGSLADSALLAMARQTLENKASRPKLWIDWGERGDGGGRGAKQMAELLEQEFGYLRGRELFVHADPMGGHDEDAWSWRLRQVLETFLPEQR